MVSKWMVRCNFNFCNSWFTFGPQAKMFCFVELWIVPYGWRWCINGCMKFVRHKKLYNWVTSCGGGMSVIPCILVVSGFIPYICEIIFIEEGLLMFDFALFAVKPPVHSSLPCPWELVSFWFFFLAFFIYINVVKDPDHAWTSLEYVIHVHLEIVLANLQSKWHLKESETTLMCINIFKCELSWSRFRDQWSVIYKYINSSCLPVSQYTSQFTSIYYLVYNVE